MRKLGWSLGKGMMKMKVMIISRAGRLMKDEANGLIGFMFRP